MIRWILGDDEVLFKQAIRDYFARFAYQSTTTDDFLNVVEIYKSGIKRNIQNWIYDVGHPILSITRLDANTIRLQQNRFSYQNVSSNTIWRIPIWYFEVFDNFTATNSTVFIQICALPESMGLGPE
jgi:aminopeptidase N